VRLIASSSDELEMQFHCLLLLDAPRSGFRIKRTFWRPRSVRELHAHARISDPKLHRNQNFRQMYVGRAPRPANGEPAQTLKSSRESVKLGGLFGAGKRGGHMARTPLMRALQRLAREHATADAIGVNVQELR
jgi:hypothetical protein